MFGDPQSLPSRALVVYFGVFQAAHLVLNSRYQLVPFSSRPPLPFAPPPEGWADQIVYFTSGMAVADLVNAAASLVFVVGFFRGERWSEWLGTVTLTVAVYAAFAFTWGMAMTGAPVFGLSYAWINVPTLPVILLFVVWSRWVVTGRVP